LPWLWRRATELGYLRTIYEYQKEYQDRGYTIVFRVSPRLVAEEYSEIVYYQSWDREGVAWWVHVDGMEHSFKLTDDAIRENSRIQWLISESQAGMD